MSLHRQLLETIRSHIGQNKVILLFGTRRVGKTFLLQQISNTYDKKYVFYNGEDMDVQELLSHRSKTHYEKLLDGARLLLIDEAQAVPDIGKILKLFIDSFPDLTVIATGSSSFDLMNVSGEPLTGRSYQYILYPISYKELEMQYGYASMKAMLSERLIYGSYPEVVTLKSVSEKKLYLKSLVQTYLLKDIFTYETIRNSKKIHDLLRLLAHQTGQEVSIDELGRNLGMSKNTVERYLDLLVKVFIIFRLGGYSSNLRKEVVKSSKWYFYDNGIRNAIIGDFRELQLRQDIGALWENYCIYERIKHQHYSGHYHEYYFWRTYDKQEIDLIELDSATLKAFEFKWNTEKKVQPPKFFMENYKDAIFELVHPGNYHSFIS